ncbi:10170_t:CDS:1, partial [Funneliformis geosporum]
SSLIRPHTPRLRCSNLGHDFAISLIAVSVIKLHSRRSSLNIFGYECAILIIAVSLIASLHVALKFRYTIFGHEPIIPFMSSSENLS